MRKIFYSIIVIIILFITNIAYAANSTETLILQSENNLLSYHEDLSKIEKNINTLNTILKEEPANIKALLMLSRTWILYGDLVVKTTQDQDKAYEKAKFYANKALEINNQSARAHLLYFISLGKILEHKDVFSALGSFAELKSHIMMAYKIAPDDAVIVGSLGIFYREIPDVMGKDIKKSEKLLKTSIEIDPNYTRALAELSITLYEEKQYKEAKSAAEKTINCPVPTDKAAWATIDKIKATQIIKKL